MKTEIIKKFETVAFFRSIKEKIAKRMENMTLQEQKDFLRKIKEGKIKIA